MNKNLLKLIVACGTACFLRLRSTSKNRNGKME